MTKIFQSEYSVYARIKNDPTGSKGLIQKMMCTLTANVEKFGSKVSGPNIVSLVNYEIFTQRPKNNQGDFVPE